MRGFLFASLAFALALGQENDLRITLQEQAGQEQKKGKGEQKNYIQFAVAVATADQSPKPPLRLLSTSGKMPGDFVHSATLKNDSDKLIVRYRLGWNLRDMKVTPVGATSGSTSFGTGLARPIDTRLPPRGKEKAPPQGITPDELGNLIKKHNIKGYFLLVVGLTEVEFDDGSKWSADPADFKGTVR